MKIHLKNDMGVVLMLFKVWKEDLIKVKDRVVLVIVIKLSSGVNFKI